MILNCNKAEKSGNLCYGFGNDICKNCIKCINGYYQEGNVPNEILSFATVQIASYQYVKTAKDIIKKLLKAEENNMYFPCDMYSADGTIKCDEAKKEEYYKLRKEAEEFIK